LASNQREHFQQAIRNRKARIAEIDAILIPVDQVITFVDFIEAVFLLSAKANKKPSTARSYESLCVFT
jgi:hypothetical protein